MPSCSRVGASCTSTALSTRTHVTHGHRSPSSSFAQSAACTNAGSIGGEEVCPDRDRKRVRLDCDKYVVSDLVELRPVAELKRCPVVMRLSVGREHQAVAVRDEIALVANCPAIL